MSIENSGNCSDHCPNCRKPLTGAVEVVETKNEGVPVIQVKETSDRNWIACDACNLVVCKSCCANATSGFCNGCWQQVEPESIVRPVVSRQDQFG